MLNAASADVDFPLTAAQVIALTQAALQTATEADDEALASRFAEANEAGCPLGRDEGVAGPTQPPATRTPTRTPTRTATPAP